MALRVSVIVLSEAPKDLGAGVEVVVGLPSKNPWSLPFAHKRIFAENVGRFDLFAYSEDDMLVSDENIRAFLNLTTALPPGEIAGFLRYEVGGDGQWSLPDVNGPFHWKPGSVRQRGGHGIAEFTNEHSAFYLLTQAQLKKAIASGGFLRDPYEGRYDMLCTAATDPYTSCGFQKVTDISALEDFLIQHLSARYAGKLGLPLAAFKQQVETLNAIGRGELRVFNLCGVESQGMGLRYAKSYYERPREELLELVPEDAERILSVGCGSGETEAELARRGAEVTAVPLDSVIGDVASRRGIEVMHSPFPRFSRDLEKRRFQCVLLTNLLHLQRDPRSWIESCSRLLEPGGTLVFEGPNFDVLPILTKRALGAGYYRKLRHFDSGGINAFSVSRLVQWVRQSGIRMEKLVWANETARDYTSGASSVWQTFRSSFRRRLFLSRQGRFTADRWLIRGRK